MSIIFDEVITYKVISTALDLPVNQIQSLLGPRNLSNLTFRYLTTEESIKVAEDVNSTLNDLTIPKAGPNRLDTWEKGWNEILENVKSEGPNRETLTPQYFRHNIFRFNGRYIQSKSFDFEQEILDILRTIIIKKYLSSSEHIVELGCGTGVNLFLLSKILQNKKLTGCDWAKASQKLINQINITMKEKIKPVNLDLLTMKEWQNIEINSDTAILTLHALEQLGSNIEPLISTLLEAKPQICVHLEPIVELYNLENEFDKIAHNYHIKRNYLIGFYSKLINLERAGRIKLIKVSRTGFGSTFQEAYTMIVWKVV